MTLEIRILRMIETLLHLKDEKLVSKMEDVLRDARIRKYESSLKPMTVEELKDRVRKSEEDVKKGNLIDIDDVEKEMENW